jgi:hypothetical protein
MAASARADAATQDDALRAAELQVAKLGTELLSPLARAAGRGHDMLAWLRKPEATQAG